MLIHHNLFIFCDDAFNGFGGASPRFNQIASGLSELGWNTTVIRAHRSCFDHTGAERDFTGRIIHTPFPVGRWPLLFDHKGIRYVYRRIMRLLGMKDLSVDPKNGWAASIDKWDILETTGVQPDAIIGVTFGDVGSLYAAKTVADKLRCPFFMEFQDPCPGIGKTLSDITSKRLDECVYSCAGIITTTKSYAEILKKRYPDAAEKIYAVHMSYDESQAAPSSESRNYASKRLVFLHAGVLYGKNQRNADALILGMKRAFEKDPTIANKCCFQLLGGWRGAKDARRLAEKLNISQAVEIRDAVPYAQSIEAMNRADILVIIKFPDPEFACVIPGKLFQYFGRNKPILGIMGKCEASELIRDSGMGMTFDFDEIDEIASFIIRYSQTPEKLRDDFTPNISFIKQFSTSSMAKKLDQILSSTHHKTETI